MTPYGIIAWERANGDAKKNKTELFNDIHEDSGSHFRGVARILRLRRHEVPCAREARGEKVFELINHTQCAQTVALEMLKQYAGALTVPDLQHYQR